MHNDKESAQKGLLASQLMRQPYLSLSLPFFSSSTFPLGNWVFMSRASRRASHVSLALTHPGVFTDVGEAEVEYAEEIPLFLSGEKKKLLLLPAITLVDT